ncbi:hypothetical protein EYF80_061697 [Liparis tanakae]|uniref:Uncharacterized protein n=1 Tax=Liparis tanakae TaxID=230148 RepID=A0A4Z2EHC3_9TELE|nr:hypothetical protein EYF80_061697 [Liparis tanakae]
MAAGTSQQRILTELQHQSAKQKERHKTANQLQAAGGGASDPPAGGSTEDIIMAPPIALRVQPPQSVLQVSVQAPPPASHNASVARDRPRTIPNILSRSRTPSSSFKNLGAAEVLSLVLAALPRKPVLTASPVPPAGITTVTLNLPSLTHQQIHLNSLPRPTITVEGPLDESLTSILNEIVFLNQQTVTSPENPEDALVGGATEQGHAHKPWLLELDSDSDDLTDSTRPQLIGNAHVLAPPPLLQMKVGGVKAAEPPSSAVAADGEEGGRRQGGVAWRPMPRLVPLGLRGNPTS